MIVARVLAIPFMLAVSSSITPPGLCQDANLALPVHQEIIISQDVQKQIAERYEDKAIDFMVFIQSIQEAILKNKIDKVAPSIQYPIRVDINGRQKLIKSRKQMLQLLPKIFTKNYKNRILEDFSDLHVLSQGIMLGRGSMWINLDQKNENWMIITINN